MRVLYINPPVATPAADNEISMALKDACDAGTEVEVASLKKGPLDVNYRYHEALLLPELLHLIKEKEQAGYDAAVIGCFYDFGLEEPRELTDRMIVTAPTESCMLLACSLGDKFSIIIGKRKWLPQMMSNVVKYGLRDRLASFKIVDIEASEFLSHNQQTEERQFQAGKEAIEQDMAEVLVLGCAWGYGFYRKLQERLGVSVLDAMITPLKYAEYLVRLRDDFGWIHSKIGTYESPPIDQALEWKLDEQYGTNIWHNMKKASPTLRKPANNHTGL